MQASWPSSCCAVRAPLAQVQAYLRARLCFVFGLLDFFSTKKPPEKPWDEFWGSGGQWLKRSPASVPAQLGGRSSYLAPFVVPLPFQRKRSLNLAAICGRCWPCEQPRPARPSLGERWEKPAGLETRRGRWWGGQPRWRRGASSPSHSSVRTGGTGAALRTRLSATWSGTRGRRGSVPAGGAAVGFGAMPPAYNEQSLHRCVMWQPCSFRELELLPSPPSSCAGFPRCVQPGCCRQAGWHLISCLWSSPSTGGVTETRRGMYP